MVMAPAYWRALVDCCSFERFLLSGRECWTCVFRNLWVGQGELKWRANDECVSCWLPLSIMKTALPFSEPKVMTLGNYLNIYEHKRDTAKGKPCSWPFASLRERRRKAAGCTLATNGNWWRSWCRIFFSCLHHSIHWTSLSLPDWYVIAPYTSFVYWCFL